MKTLLLIAIITIFFGNCFGQQPTPNEEKIYYDTLKLFQPRPAKEDIAVPQDYKHSIDLTQSGYTITVSGVSYTKSNVEELVLFIKNNRKQIIKQKLIIISSSGTSYEKIVSTLDIMSQQKIENYKLVSADGRLPQTAPIVVQSTKPFTKDIDLADSTVLKISIMRSFCITSLLNNSNIHMGISELAKFIENNKMSIDPYKIVVMGASKLPYTAVEPVISLLMNHNYFNYHLISKDDFRTILTIDDSSYWKKVSTIDFVDTLISYGDNYIFRIEVYPPKQWYDEKCIAKLERLRNDSVYSASVITPSAEEWGEIFCGLTTISQEIDLLIEGIRKRHYPDHRSSSCFFHPKKY